ncbi:FAD binding domain-containing protein [Colletotrichum orchidophilum]|uniref:FAD binding domain-containing protein n=1 Tax=Colletotrichum orchidophilum TaxID=1209926 RepID=A0A1G4B7K4_9PEZI|nr:FAD binding domain-containing protein [Colletotrichum orchidophilum]OHE97401.1 FAD binding domain-containing protein [Colletotrichum orchidophilum]
MTVQPFTVIIVGGGPSGITAAHVLQRAGIDFVVLERRDSIVGDAGASLVLGPGSMRVFHQLGILEQLMEIGNMLSSGMGFTADGHIFKQSLIGDYMMKNHGAGLTTFHRANLIQVLYDTLPESAKARYFTGKKLSNVDSTETGVTVTCEDGSKYSGSMIIGADGVHSTTRRQMRELALAEDPNRAWDPVNPYKIQYQCLWASFPRPTAAGQGCETQSKDRSIMYLTGKERGWIFLYEKLTAPIPERISFTPEQLEEYAERFADWPVTETLKVKDVFKERYSAGGAGLEEGICNNWSWGGRMVLVGDAVHKFTPNAGLGFNNGLQDVVAVCNRLHKLVSNGDKPSPSPTELQKLFDDYREERHQLLEKDLDASARLTRMHAWASTWDWIMARYVMAFSFVERIFFTLKRSPSIQKAKVLDFVPATEVCKGKYQWLYPFPCEK